MVRRWFIGFWLIFIFTDISFSQDQPETGEYLQDIIEEEISSSDAEVDVTEIYEDLNDFYKKPLNLNTADEDDLGKLHMLSDFQIYSILAYRNKNGPFISIYELQLVFGFTPDLIQKISPYTTLSSDSSLIGLLSKKSILAGHHQFLVKSGRILESQKGYLPANDSSLLNSPNSHYLGNPWKIAFKYKFNLKNRLFAGITAEKDPGEEFFKGINKKGFDFYSGYIQVNHIGKIKRLCFGDYNLGIGQGLIVWSGFSINKSPFQISLAKSNQGFRYSSSFNEYRSLRGAAATITYKHFDFTLFSSFKKPDANITGYDSIHHKVLTFSSFQESGLHNTANLAADKHSINEFMNGSSLIFKHNHIKVSLNLVNIHYNASYSPILQPYNYFKNIEKNNWYTSISYQIYDRNINIFGEAAWQINYGYALLNGTNIRMSSSVEAVFLHRYYARNYFSPYSSAFGENSLNANEQGLYSGLVLYPLRKIKISAFYDLYSFPWLKYLTNAPSNGSDFMFQAEYNNFPVISMYFRYRNKSGFENSDSEDSSISKIIISQINRQSFRYQVSYKINNNIYLKNRIDYLILEKNNKKEKGFLIFQDVNYKFSKIPLVIYGLIAFFSTDSYQSRIYCYENDLLYDFSVWPYSDKGMRTGLMISYDVFRNCSIQVKLSQNYFPYSETTGTGLNETDKNTRTELKGQLIVKL